ncbi:transcriptional regulator [Pasteurella bettyae]|uniref:Uncharacterized protein n=1 Tax=Pasteurella bettyae CCUG 2042 TaxID=1095749 RepID=I3DKB8_9PAST|nr:YdaS family helix-turn-helix protein [Pasteurella bettyae]EIJ72161.1 hypothetical protein HMPREF1052_2048 [Pasteurella bettyae CCUG 2042]SUB20781.1 Uncharacterized protein conserved in bacteria, prophage-related [Pasteurella bettyae]
MSGFNPKIKQAIEIVGSQANLANECNVAQPTVFKWLNGSEYSAKYAARIEIATQGAVTARELCFALLNESDKQKI